MLYSPFDQLEFGGKNCFVVSFSCRSGSRFRSSMFTGSYSRKSEWSILEKLPRRCCSNFPFFCRGLWWQAQVHVFCSYSPFACSPSRIIPLKVRVCSNCSQDNFSIHKMDRRSAQRFADISLYCFLLCCTTDDFQIRQR